jgi:hypothetical protein
MSLWTDFVKEYAAKNNLTYKQAMSDPRCSALYKEAKAGADKKEAKAKELYLKYAPIVNAPPEPDYEEPDEEEVGRLIAEANRKQKRDKKKEQPKMWVFKPTKNNYGSTEVETRYMLNALPRNRAIAREGLYKNSEGEDFTVGDFKDAIDKTKKPETSPLLRIAKFLQRNDFGKIVYSK